MHWVDWARLLGNRAEAEPVAGEAIASFEPLARLRPVLKEMCEAAGGLQAAVARKSLPPPMLAALRTDREARFK